MIDSFDYKEPTCALCGGKDFYTPSKDSPDGRIPIGRIIEKIDGLFDKNDYEEAGRLLEYWKNEAIKLKDRNGELSLESELIGYFRKIGKKQETYLAIDRAITLIDCLKLSKSVSGATVFLNIATGYKAFGESEKALTFYEKTLEIYNEKLEKTDRLFAGLYNNAALALVDLKKYDKAKDYYLNAIDILESNDDTEADRAITYINLAHLYEAFNNDKNEITDCLFKAYYLLSSEKLPQNGYLAFVLSKCAPSYSHFGYELIARELSQKSEKIYERNRNR